MKMFDDGMTQQEKQVLVDQVVFHHNVLVHIPGFTSIAGSATFGLAKELVAEGENDMALYLLSKCDDPAGEAITQ